MTIKKVLVVSVLFFASLTVFLPTYLVASDYGNVILTVSTFLFGIFAGFCILVTTNDYNVVRGLAADETASWIALYQTIRVYDLNVAAKLKPLLSEYIIRSFDYDFIDYARETKTEFKSMQELVNEIPVDDTKASVHQNILDRMSDVVVARQHLTALGKRSLSVTEWTVLVILAVTVIATMFSLRSGSIFFDAVTVAVSSALTLILVLVRDIDRYAWNDAAFGYEVFNNVLVALGELPYYRKDFIDRGIVFPHEKVYQLGILLNPGKSWERRIEIVENK
jgi:hypothetical protein